MGVNKMGSPFKETIHFYLFVIGIMVVILASYNLFWGFVGVSALLGLIIYNWYSNTIRSKKLKKYVETISSSIDSAARYAVFNLPVPLTVVDIDGRINWYNSKFIEMLDDDSVIGKNISDLVPTISQEQFNASGEQKNIKIGDRLYNVYANAVALEEDQSDIAIMLYWFDITEVHQLQTRFEEEKSVVAMINVDNYEDVMNETKEDRIPFLTSEIDKKINLWANRMNAMIKRYQKDKYIVVFQAKYLENLEAKRFAILDEVREIEVGNKIPATLSIGIGVNGKTPIALEEDAYASLELALGRGGDQVVLRKKNAYEFYGGKTKAVEKRNRVKARVIAHGFRSLIEESSKVVVMGHKNPDMDSYGAAIGVYRSVLNLGKEAYIVLNDVTEAIDNIHALFKNNSLYVYISSEEAKDLVDENTLVVVVDTHKPSLTECPDILSQTRQIVLMDHHRRSAEFIENAVLKYLEPYASSTSELVTEVFQYMDTRHKIEKEEADALLAGITVDTKNFTLKTGVRTFDAASYLRRQGADTIRVRQLFQDDLETFIEKANIVGTAIKYHDSIAISTSDASLESIQVIAAQAADNLLTIKGVTASFVIGKRPEGTVFISGRSLGDVNVQVILESLGGGGHLEIAGAQFEDETIEHVKERLIEAIDNYFKEGVSS